MKASEWRGNGESGTNEAGANTPRKSGLLPDPWRRGVSFNEAAANVPRKSPSVRVVSGTSSVRLQ